MVFQYLKNAYLYCLWLKRATRWVINGFFQWETNPLACLKHFNQYISNKYCSSFLVNIIMRIVKYIRRTLKKRDSSTSSSSPGIIEGLLECLSISSALLGYLAAMVSRPIHSQQHNQHRTPDPEWWNASIIIMLSNRALARAREVISSYFPSRSSMHGHRVQWNITC